MQIFVVCGSAGEYSDRSEWVVTAYQTEAAAKRHVEEATRYAHAWYDFTRSAAWRALGPLQVEKAEKSANPMDSRFTYDYYCETSYWFSETELKAEFTAPEVLQ